MTDRSRATTAVTDTSEATEEIIYVQDTGSAVQPDTETIHMSTPPENCIATEDITPGSEIQTTYFESDVVMSTAPQDDQDNYVMMADDQHQTSEYQTSQQITKSVRQSTEQSVNNAGDDQKQDSEPHVEETAGDMKYIKAK